MPAPRSGRALTAVATAVALAALTGALAGCAPQPSSRFVSSPEQDIVVKVPRNWTLVRSGVPRANASAAPSPGAWLAVLDGAKTPGGAALATSDVKDPLAITEALVLSDGAPVDTSDDELRDFVLPVTTSGRTQAALTTPWVKTFSKIAEIPISTSTAHGIHVTYSYDLGHGVQVFDQVALANKSRTRVYLFLVQCDQVCWNHQQRTISETVNSFSVKVS